ncbi:4Fe-4S ferredoxin [Rhodoferax koreense]|uniref:4Fe-4S ferredoxin n=1 Tax=Rhodoferax koreensis TaxID=1842727 RepID=A0A1P8JS27_9BURK|nr:GMC oxidoreductase [Rhodoferax koreense]APW36528.1 4Fe-4S ferredoxin [Rhodoferax koreense]
MSADFDVIVIGSGPAGVSAAFPLVQAGLRVAMLDGGRTQAVAPPRADFLTARATDPHQWAWMIGRDFHALRAMDAVSPKLRVPTQAFAFEGFQLANRIAATPFVAVGSLATGGLSNAWGCGVARFSDAEARMPFPVADLGPSYREVARRMGLSGGGGDDLSDYFGLDEDCDPPVPMDRAHEAMWRRYTKARTSLCKGGFRLGRSRVAVLSRPREDRQACDLAGNCLFGCSRQAMYSASADVERLRAFPNFHWLPGHLVDSIVVDGERTVVQLREPSGTCARLAARRLFVAAGTLASTRLVLQALQRREPVPLLSCPTAAFLLWLPGLLGQPRERGFGLGQLSYALQLTGGRTAFGSTFATTGIPMWELARHLPLGRSTALQVLRDLLGSCVVGNLFLPGELSDARARLDDRDTLRIEGGWRQADVEDLLREARRKLAGAYRKMNAWMLPGSFTPGRPGSDIHYAGTLPMAADPGAGQTSVQGEVRGLRHVHVVDGACLPALPEKSHTLTLMANADRIGRLIAPTLI